MTSQETQTEGERRRVTLPSSTPDKGTPSKKGSEEPNRISNTEFQKRVTSDRSDEPVFSCQFEVFGIVQGRVFTNRIVAIISYLAPTGVSFRMVRACWEMGSSKPL